jgi:hypothetical protein
MPDRTRKRTNKAKALEAWDNEGGTTSRTPQKDRDKPMALTAKEASLLNSAEHFGARFRYCRISN